MTTTPNRARNSIRYRRSDGFLFTYFFPLGIIFQTFLLLSRALQLKASFFSQRTLCPIILIDLMEDLTFRQDVSKDSGEGEANENYFFRFFLFLLPCFLSLRGRKKRVWSEREKKI